MMIKQAGFMACALLALTAIGAFAQDKPQEKPKETTIVIKDDVTPKAKKAAKATKKAAKKTADAVKDTDVVIKDDVSPKAKAAGKAVSDASITTAVKTRLMSDDVARGTSIDVDTTGGVVTIKGTVPTAADKARIGDLVARTTGVKTVTNNLTVR